MNDEELIKDYISLLNDCQLQNLQMLILVEMHKRGYVNPRSIEGMETYVLAPGIKK